MKAIVSFVAAMTVAATPVMAKSSAPVYKAEIWAFNGDVIRSSIKCDLSRVARDIKGIAPRKAQAKILVKLENTKEEVGELSFDLPKLFTKASAKREQTIVAGEEIELVYNISVENGLNCKKNNKFNTGIYDCLRDKGSILRDKSDVSSSIKCKNTIDVKRVISSQTGLKVWVIDIGPSGTASEKGVYSFEVSVPPPGTN